MLVGAKAVRIWPKAGKEAVFIRNIKMACDIECFPRSVKDKKEMFQSISTF